jgi:hypothetical protein
MQQWHCDDLDLDLDLGLSIAYFSTLSLLFFFFFCPFIVLLHFISFPFFGAGGSRGYFLTFPPAYASHNVVVGQTNPKVTWPCPEHPPQAPFQGMQAAVYCLLRLLLRRSTVVGTLHALFRWQGRFVTCTV